MSYLTTKDQAAVAQDGIKYPCRVATTGTVTLAATITTVDSVALVDGDRVLLKDQTILSECGIYEWDSGTQLLTRARDAFTFTDGTQVLVGEGATHADTMWIQTTNEPITTGVTGLVFGLQASSVIADHGALSGLGDNDHPQYQLASEKGAANGYAPLDASSEIADATHGNRSGGALHAEATAGTAGFLSATDKAKLNASGPLATVTAPADVAVQASATGTDTSSARADHKHNISVGTPVEITDSTTAGGSATSLALSDHSHAHGNRGGGALHAAATTSVAGFMSGTDKTNIDDNLKKVNNTATVDPSASQDDTRGYSIGSVWVNISADRSFICVDNATGAAIWERVNALHAVSHISGGADEVDGDKLDIDWNPTYYTPTVAPAEVDSVNQLTAHLAGIDSSLGGKASTNHDASHLLAGADEINGDKLGISWDPTNYTPSITPAEATSVDHLTAHLYGIDQALGDKVDGPASSASLSIPRFGNTTGKDLIDSLITISNGHTIGGTYRLDLPTASNTGLTTTTSTSFTTRISCSTTPHTVVNDYIILFNVEGRANTVATSMPRIQIYVNATDSAGTGGTLVFDGVVPLTGSTAVWTTLSGAPFWINATSGSLRYVVMRYASPDGNSVSIQRATLFVIPVG